MAMRWAGLKQPGLAAEVEDLAVVPRTAARRPAWQASRRAWPAVIFSPVLVWAIPAAVRSASRVSWSISTTREVALPPWRGRSDLRIRSRRATNAMPCWRAIGRFANSSSTRRCEPERRLDRLVVPVVVAAGCGEGGQEGAQQAGGQVGDAGVQVGGAVAAAAQGQPGHRGGAAFLVEEPLVVGVLGDVGGQVLQDAGPEGPQLPRPELVGLGDQQRLGLGQQVLAEVLWAASPTPRR